MKTGIVNLGMPYARKTSSRSLFSREENPDTQTPPSHYLIAHSDGGARGNPGPAGYGVVIQDQSGSKVANLSQYLGHQTNNFAEYQGLIAALEYALQRGPKALKLISDSELLVRQIKGIYKVKNPTLRDLHGRAKELIAQLEWFSIGHALREHNREADHLANQAMDQGMGRSAPRESPREAQVKPPSPTAQRSDRGTSNSSRLSFEAATPDSSEWEGVIRNGVVELTNGRFPEGSRVQVRLKQKA